MSFGFFGDRLKCALAPLKCALAPRSLLGGFSQAGLIYLLPCVLGWAFDTAFQRDSRLPGFSTPLQEKSLPLCSWPSQAGRF